MKKLLIMMLLGGYAQLAVAAWGEKYIETHIDIDARPAVVWEILADIDSYPEWNPYHVEVQGELQLGSPLVVRIHKPNGTRLQIEPDVMRVLPLQELTWGGGIRGIFIWRAHLPTGAFDCGSHTPEPQRIILWHCGAIC